MRKGPHSQIIPVTSVRKIPQIDLVAEGDAEAKHVREDKTFSSELVEPGTQGTMANRGSPTITPTTSTQSEPSGYYGGISVLSLGGNASASHVRSGYSFSSDSVGRNVDGTMANRGSWSRTISHPNDSYSGSSGYYSSVSVDSDITNRGSVSITPTTTDQTIAEGYHSGNGSVDGDSDLVSSNIKDGISIFGVSGNVTEGSDVESVQDGVLYFPDGGEDGSYSQGEKTIDYIDINISSVDTSRSFVIAKTPYPRDWPEDGLSFELLNSTTLRVKRVYYAHAEEDSVDWYYRVVEMRNVSVQYVHFNWPDSTSTTTSISSVDPTNTFVFLTVYGRDGSSSGGRHLTAGWIEDSTTLRLKRMFSWFHYDYVWADIYVVELAK